MAPKVSVPKTEGRQEVAWRSHVLLSAQRPYPTKQGYFLKKGIEALTYDDFVAKFDASTAESRNRPEVSFSTLCGTLVHAKPLLKDRASK